MTSETDCPANIEPLTMIEYPGFVKNIDKAFETLGGLENIERAFDSHKDRLELKFRRSDPLAHAAYGDRVPKKCLVLRMRKKNLAAGTSKSSDKSVFELEVVGKIQTAFRFDTIAEFQWLPMERINVVNKIKSEQLSSGVSIERSPESLNPEYVSILNEVLPIKNPFDNTLKSFNPDAPLLILPALFSRFDTPREIHQPHPKFRSKEMREEFERQQSLSIIGRTRKKRSTMSYLLNFADTVPDKAPEKLVKERSTLSAQERSMIPILVRCFERQRIWSKAALCFELNCAPIEIKYILPLVAFHYLTGPFRTMWVRYGYNPHKDPTSKTLQTLDFRVRNPQDQQEYSRRSMNQYQLPLRKNAEKARYNHQVDLKSVMTHTSSLNIEDDGFDDIPSMKNQASMEAMCKFRRDLIPPARQLSYQLKDIEVDEIQAIVHSNDGREHNQCFEKDGWLPEGSIERIRKIMSRILSETLETITSQLEKTPDEANQ